MTNSNLIYSLKNIQNLLKRRTKKKKNQKEIRSKRIKSREIDVYSLLSSTTNVKHDSKHIHKGSLVLCPTIQVHHVIEYLNHHY